MTQEEEDLAEYANRRNVVETFTEQIGGQYLLDPNEINGWGRIGVFDNTNSEDLGNVGNPTQRRAGGLTYPFPVRLKRFVAWHDNSNAAAQAWRWTIIKQTKTGGSNVVNTTIVYDEPTLRDYTNNTNQSTDIQDINVDFAAGEIIVLGVSAPTAATTNYYVRVQSGYFLFEKI